MERIGYPMRKIEALLCEYANFVTPDKIAKQELRSLMKAALATSGNALTVQNGEKMDQATINMAEQLMDCTTDKLHYNAGQTLIKYAKMEAFFKQHAALTYQAWSAINEKG